MGGGGGIIEDVGDFFQENVIDPIKDDPLSAVATVVGYSLGGPAGAAIANTAAGVAQGEELDDAIKGGVTAGATAYVGGELFGGDGGVYGGDVESQLGGFYGDAGSSAGATVPSAFDTAVNQTISGQSPDLQVGTSGFGTALRPASEVAADLTSGGFSAGTAANLAGMTAAGTGATNLLGGATALSPLTVSPSLSIQDAFRGARLAQGLLSPQQQQQYNPYAQMQALQQQQGAVDYSEILKLLARSPQATGLLGTQYQPQPINISTLLG